MLAGLIAARRGAAPEVRGFARAAEILPIRVVTRASDLPDPALLGSAITAAVDAGAQVVLVGAAVRDDPALSAATAAALESGVSVVAAAGDGDDPALAFPASYDGVIAVSATDDMDAVRPVNALGRVTVGAPGVDMVGIGLDGGYVGAQQGSALAAAIVAATVADLRVTFPELTPAQLRERLAGTADRPGIAVPDAALGWGVVNPVTGIDGADRGAWHPGRGQRDIHHTDRGCGDRAAGPGLRRPEPGQYQSQVRAFPLQRCRSPCRRNRRTTGGPWWWPAPS